MPHTAVYSKLQNPFRISNFEYILLLSMQSSRSLTIMIDSGTDNCPFSTVDYKGEFLVASCYSFFIYHTNSFNRDSRREAIRAFVSSRLAVVRKRCCCLSNVGSSRTIYVPFS